MFFHSFVDIALKLKTSKNGGDMSFVLDNISKTLTKLGDEPAKRLLKETGIQRTKAKGCAYVWDLLANRYDDIAVGSFDRFEEVVDGPTENILDIVFSGINLEAKNWKEARSFLPVTGSSFKQLKAYFGENKLFAYYFNHNGGVSVAAPMREYLNNVFKNNAALKELWDSGFLEEQYFKIYGKRIGRTAFRNKAKNGKLGSLLESLIKE